MHTYSNQRWSLGDNASSDLPTCALALKFAHPFFK